MTKRRLLLVLDSLSLALSLVDLALAVRARKGGTAPPEMQCPQCDATIRLH